MNRLTSSAIAPGRAGLQSVRSCSRLKVRLCRRLGSASLLLLLRYEPDMMYILIGLEDHYGMMLLVPESADQLKHFLAQSSLSLRSHCQSI